MPTGTTGFHTYMAAEYLSLTLELRGEVQSGAGNLGATGYKCFPRTDYTAQRRCSFQPSRQLGENCGLDPDGSSNRKKF